MASLLAEWRRLADARPRAELYRLWHVASSAGFTIPHALETIGVRDDAGVEAARRWLRDGTRRGASLTSLVADRAAPFAAFDVALLTLGDEAGRLEESLRLLAEFHERRHRLMRTVQKRLAYPLFTAICASFIAPFPMLLAGHARAYLATVLLAGATWLLLGGAIVRSAAARFARDPHLVRARFSRALATAVEAGVPLPRAARLAADASGDPRIAQFVSGVTERRLTERPLSETLASCPRMSPELLAVLANAERTGDYTATLRRLADLYDDGFR